MSKENLNKENLNNDNFKIEDAFDEIESIVRKMEEKDVTLEESFDLYTKGCQLLSKCNEQIDSYEKKIIILSDGE